LQFCSKGHKSHGELVCKALEHIDFFLHQPKQALGKHGPVTAFGIITVYGPEDNWKAINVDDRPIKR